MSAGPGTLLEERRWARHGVVSLREDVRNLLWRHGSACGIGPDAAHYLWALVDLVPERAWDGDRGRATVGRAALRDDWWLDNMEAECLPPLRALGLVREFARVAEADVVLDLDLRGLRPMLPVLHGLERGRLRRARELADLGTAVRAANREVSDLLAGCVGGGLIDGDRARRLRERVVGNDFVDWVLAEAGLDGAGKRRRLRGLVRLRRLLGSRLRGGQPRSTTTENTDVPHRFGRGAALRSVRPLFHGSPEPEERR